MKKYIKIIAFVTALLMLLPFASCNDADEPDVTSDMAQTDTDSIALTTAEEETDSDKTASTETESDKTEDDEAVTDETTPDETVPDVTVSDETEPDETTPDETVPDVTVSDETEPEETKPTETEAEETKEVYTEKTASVTNIRTWTFDDAFAGKVIGIYCETEPYAEVIMCDLSGKVIMREHAIDKYFYGRFVMPEGRQSAQVVIYAKSEGKAISDPSSTLVLRFSETVGANAMIAHDSHVFLNWYRDHYAGNAVIPGTTKAEQENYMYGIKNYLKAQLAAVREVTGKNTKIITVICTNPATIYHETQYSEAEGGWGDHSLPTSTTQFAEYMKNDEDIYVLDLRELLEKNKNDRLLFMQADSHWTTVGAYYGYYLAAKKVKNDFPNTIIYDLDKDFNVQIVPGGGDLLNFMGAANLGVHAAVTNVTWISDSMKAPADAPTAYVMGDSYYGSISGYLDLLFSKVYLNEPETNPPLYDYTLEDLAAKKPDYLFYIWTERNIDGSLGYFTSYINAGNIK